MKKLLLILFALTGSGCLLTFAQSEDMNPFAKFNYDANVVVFGAGVNSDSDPHVEQTKIIEIGSVMFDTELKQVVGFADENDNPIVLNADATSTSIDPHCEKYYWISPYAYCFNNPVRFIDPDGRDVWEINNKGEIVQRIEDKTQDAFYMVAKDSDGNYQRTYTADSDGNNEYNSVSFEYGTVESQRTINLNSTDSYDVYQVRGDDNGTQLFEFLGQNVTGSSSMVEVSQAMTGAEGKQGLNFITTAHKARTEPGIVYLFNKQLRHGYTIRELNHTHPVSMNASPGDKGFAKEATQILKSRNLNAPNFYIYYVKNQTYYPFTQ